MSLSAECCFDSSPDALSCFVATSFSTRTLTSDSPPPSLPPPSSPPPSLPPPSPCYDVPGTWTRSSLSPGCYATRDAERCCRSSDPRSAFYTGDAADCVYRSQGDMSGNHCQPAGWASSNGFPSSTWGDCASILGLSSCPPPASPPPAPPADVDSYSTPDAEDPDSDNDGSPDAEEGMADNDSDGIPNSLDPDSDGDGLLDAEEHGSDADSDGILDRDESNTADANSDGIPDAMDSTTPALVRQDPHVHFAHGGRADFRGRNGAYYNFFSSPRLAVNVKTEDATFRLHGGKLIVHGSFLTEAHIVAGSSNPSFFSHSLNDENWGWNVINGTCKNHHFKFGKWGFKQCGELRIEMTFSTATFTLGNWTITVRGNHVYDWISGPKHRIDVSFSAKGDAATRSLPHGIIGQSFASAAPRYGLLDDYPKAGEFTTSAMGEGAIEGEAALYEMPSSHATDYAFSRFHKAEAAIDPDPLLALGASAATVQEQDM